MEKKTIVICSSATFYKELLAIEKKLKRLGFKVKIPITARFMQKSNNFNVNDYKTWSKNRSDYKKKTQLIKDHFKKIVDSAAILVINSKKKNVEGYIGGNVLMEMALAFHYKKPIYVLNELSNLSMFKEEVLGMNPVFLKRDLKKIKL